MLLLVWQSLSVGLSMNVRTLYLHHSNIHWCFRDPDFMLTKQNIQVLKQMMTCNSESKRFECNFYVISLHLKKQILDLHDMRSRVYETFALISTIKQWKSSYLSSWVESRYRYLHTITYVIAFAVCSSFHN